MRLTTVIVIESLVFVYLLLQGLLIGWDKLFIPRDWAHFQMHGLALCYLFLALLRVFIRSLYHGRPLPRFSDLFLLILVVLNLVLPVYSWLIHLTYISAEWRSLLFIICHGASFYSIYLLLKGFPGLDPGGFWQKRRTLLVFSVLLLCYVSMTPFVMFTHISTGDEPHYLLMSHSLIHDFDCNLKNNYRAADYTVFYPGTLEPQPTDLISEQEVTSYHSPLLSFFIMPGYALAGRLGAVLIMNAFGAALFTVLYLYLLRLFTPEISLKVIFMCLLSLPFSMYSFMIFPEVPAALIVMFLFHHISIGTFNKKNVVVLLVLLIVLCFLKMRFLPIALGLLAYHFYQRSAGKNVLLLFSIMVSSLTGFVLLFFVLSQYGPLYLLRYGHFFSDARHMLTTWNISLLSSGFGLLFDQEFGLLFQAPIYLLALWTAALNRKVRMQSTLGSEMVWALLIFLVYFLVLLKTKGLIWHGGWAPPLRFLCVILPLVAPLIATIMTIRNPFFQSLRMFLIGAGLFLSGLFWAIPGIAYNHLDGTSQWLEFIGSHVGRNLNAVFPSFVRPNLALYPFLIVLLVLALYLIYARFETTKDAVVSPPSLKTGSWTWFAVILFCLIGVLKIQPLLPTYQLEAEDRADFYCPEGQFYPLEFKPEHRRSALFPIGCEMRTNGFISASFVAYSNHCTLRIWAKGTAAADRWPHMMVKLNNTPVGATLVLSDAVIMGKPLNLRVKHKLEKDRLASESMRWTPYDFPVTCDKGKNTLSIHFLNDYFDPHSRQDRNLAIDRVDIIPDFLNSHTERKGIVLFPWFLHFDIR